MKKRNIMLGTAIMLAVLLVAGGTMAWFTAEAEVTNEFTAGTVDIDLLENEVVIGGEVGGLDIENVNPGDEYDKLIQVKSNGSKRTYVRVKLTPEWALVSGNSFTGNFNATSLPPAMLVGVNATDWILDGGYYYYKDILTTGITTNALITGVKFDGPNMGNEYQGSTFKLKVEVEAIQATNNAFTSWGITSLPAGVELITP